MVVHIELCQELHALESVEENSVFGSSENSLTVHFNSDDLRDEGDLDSS